jgi:hypothetical protein
MQTNFKNLAELKNKIETGQKMYIENYLNPSRNRVTKVRNKQSYFFTVDNPDGKESWIINGAVTLKNYGFDFKPDEEKVNIYYKQDNKPFVTLYFNDTIIKGKEGIM